MGSPPGSHGVEGNFLWTIYENAWTICGITTSGAQGGFLPRYSMGRAKLVVAARLAFMPAAAAQGGV